ncbi:MAG: hypothetical protein BRD49_02115 [Bacteroidetes bacterium SW_10_40_5]|nr:MAG: hypothetical protein BRD49_02115 [Bacteroidetes bacterium SW_10_40_5]
MKLQLLFFSKYGKIFLIALLSGKLKRSTEVQQWFLLNGWLDYIVLSIDAPGAGLMAGWYIIFGSILMKKPSYLMLILALLLHFY